MVSQGIGTQWKKCFLYTQHPTMSRQGNKTTRSRRFISLHLWNGDCDGSPRILMTLQQSHRQHWHVEDQEDLSLFIHGMEIMMAHRESEWHFNNLTGGSIDMLKIRNLQHVEWWCYSNPGTKPKLEWDYDYNEQWQVVNLWRRMPKIINSSLPSIYWSKRPMKLFLLCHQQGCLDGPALPSLQTLPPLLHHR